MVSILLISTLLTAFLMNAGLMLGFCPFCLWLNHQLRFAGQLWDLLEGGVDGILHWFLGKVAIWMAKPDLQDSTGSMEKEGETSQQKEPSQAQAGESSHGIENETHLLCLLCLSQFLEITTTGDLHSHTKNAPRGSRGQPYPNCLEKGSTSNDLQAPPSPKPPAIRAGRPCLQPTGTPPGGVVPQVRACSGLSPKTQP